MQNLLEETDKPMSKAEFIEYLESTLIPDLDEAKMTATANDFRTCVKFMKEG